MGQPLQEAVCALLLPIMEAVKGGRTRVYMSQDVLTSSLQLLVGLLHPLVLATQLISGPNNGLSPLLYCVMLPWLPDMLLFIQDRLISGLQTTVSYIYPPTVIVIIIIVSFRSSFS